MGDERAAGSTRKGATAQEEAEERQESGGGGRGGGRVILPASQDCNPPTGRDSSGGRGSSHGLCTATVLAGRLNWNSNHQPLL